MYELAAEQLATAKELFLHWQELRLSRSPAVARALRVKVTEEDRWRAGIGALSNTWADELLRRADAAIVYATGEWRRVEKADDQNQNQPPPPGSQIPWLPSAGHGADQPAPLPPNANEVRQRLTTGVNQEAMKQGGMTTYLGLAGETGAKSGQAALEKLGLNKTFSWAHPQNMARDMYQVRGSKVIAGMYGNHLNDLTKLIIDATDPRHPKTLQEVRAAINEKWPGMRAWQVDRIARTETAAVWSATSAAAYQANGIDAFDSMVATGPSIDVETNGACDMCVEAGASGPFSIGSSDLPPWHPNAVFGDDLLFAPYGRLQQLVRGYYRGPAVLLRAGDHELTIGPNHPMLTQRGMVPANELTEGDNLVYDKRIEWIRAEGSVEANVNEVPLLKNAFSTAKSLGYHVRLPATATHDFHGDVVGIQDEVDVVDVDGYLLPILDSGGIEQLRDQHLVTSNPKLSLVPRLCAPLKSLARIDLTATRIPRRERKLLTQLWSRVREASKVSTTNALDVTRAPLRVGPQRLSCRATDFTLLRVTHVVESWFEGWAYDATTEQTIYNIDGFVVSNCRCEILPVLDDPETGEPWLPPDEPWTGQDLTVKPRPLSSVGDPLPPSPTEPPSIEPAPEPVPTPREVAGQAEVTELRDSYQRTNTSYVDEHAEQVDNEMVDALSHTVGPLRAPGKTGEVYVIRDVDGTVRGAMALTVGKDDVYIEHVASNVRGGGTALARVAARRAKELGVGIGGQSLDDAVTFWERLGFKVLNSETNEIELKPGEALDRLAARSGEAGAADTVSATPEVPESKTELEAGADLPNPPNELNYRPSLLSALDKSGVPDDVPLALPMHVISVGKSEYQAMPYNKWFVWKHRGTVVQYEGSFKAIPTPDQIARVNRLLDSVPDDVRSWQESNAELSAPRQVIVAQGVSPDTDYFKRKYGTGTIAAQGGSGKIWFWRGDVNLEQGTYDHELGHVLGVLGGPPNETEWKAAQRTDMKLARNRNEVTRGPGLHGMQFGRIGVTNYGETNATEDWAESTMFYMQDLRRDVDTFRESFPNRAKIMEEYYRGVNFEPKYPPAPEVSPPYADHARTILSGTGIDVVEPPHGKYLLLKYGKRSVGKVFQTRKQAELGQVRIEIPEKVWRLLSPEDRGRWEEGVRGYYNYLAGKPGYASADDAKAMLWHAVSKFDVNKLRARLRLPAVG